MTSAASGITVHLLSRVVGTRILTLDLILGDGALAPVWETREPHPPELPRVVDPIREAGSSGALAQPIMTSPIVLRGESVTDGTPPATSFQLRAQEPRHEGAGAVSGSEVIDPRTEGR
jgi:hypothetical protein